MPAFRVEEVDYASKQYEELVKVRNFNINGWLRRKVMDEMLVSYFAFRNGLHCWANCSVCRGATSVMPESLYSKALQLAHEDHFGIVCSNYQLQSFVWWPKSSPMLEHMVKNYPACCETDKAQVGVRDVPHGKIISR